LESASGPWFLLVGRILFSLRFETPILYSFSLTPNLLIRLYRQDPNNRNQSYPQACFVVTATRPRLSARKPDAARLKQQRVDHPDWDYNPDTLVVRVSRDTFEGLTQYPITARWPTQRRRWRNTESKIGSHVRLYHDREVLSKSLKRIRNNKPSLIHPRLSKLSTLFGSRTHPDPTSQSQKGSA
jgi:hypothetical protein